MIRTIGRPRLLQCCLASLARCDPPADEVVVVDQSGGRDVAEVVAAFGGARVRRIVDRGRGRGRAVNVGVRSARNDLILVTDDDCTVAPDWIGTAAALTALFPGYIVTGRVLPAGDPRAVPSTIADERPRDYTGSRARGVLYAGNMACSRDELLQFGGFDESIVPFASDNDVCFRWLKAGHGLRYEPGMVVWHHDWRTPEQMIELHRDYAYSEGLFYGKHLRAGELRVLCYLASDLRDGVRARVGLLLRPGPRWWDWRLGVLPWVLVGLVDGVRGRVVPPDQRRGAR